jgi:hypothetical protein
MSTLNDAYYAAGAAWATATKARPVGRSIYSADWDVAIVLDSARVDLFEQALAESAIASTADAVWSRGSITTEWLSQTFRPPATDDIAKTTLLSANPHTSTVFRDGEWLTNADEVSIPYPENPAVAMGTFHEVREMWRTHATTAGAVTAETMAAATIQTYREQGGLLVSFWLQPHEPFIAPDAPIEGGAATEENVWATLAAGDGDPEAVWEAYRANHRYALSWVETVCKSVDARVLVTADHGNLFGDLGQYGHPFGMLHPAVRKVPWLVVDASAEWNPDLEAMLARARDRPAADVDAQLRALGYR